LATGWRSSRLRNDGTAALERIERAIEVLEGRPPDSNLLIGAGVFVAAIQLTGQWSAIRYIPQPGEFPGWSAASDPTDLIDQTLRGLPLAAAITTWWLLLDYPPSAATRRTKPIGDAPAPLQLPMGPAADDGTRTDATMAVDPGTAVTSLEATCGGGGHDLDDPDRPGAHRGTSDFSDRPLAAGAVGLGNAQAAV
jgi:hypothetical protein